MRAIIHEVFRVLLAVVIPLAAFTTGLRAPKPEAGEARLWQRPGQLSRDLLAVLILVPLWVLLLVFIMPVSPVVRAGLLIAALAVGIGPAASMQRMGGATHAAREALDLNLVVLVISLLFVPVGFAALASLFHRDLEISVWAVAKVVLGRALLPLLLGLGVARLWPRFAASAAPRLMKIVTIVLLAVLVLALAATWKHLAAVGAIGWLTAAAAALGAVVIGHLLGGPNPEDRGVVAAASVMRFPALALALAAVPPRGKEMIPVVLVYVLAAFLILAAYGAFMARRRRKVDQGGGHETLTPLRPAPRGA
jgi:bile acid:Na+ symporter, BASS family